MRRGVAQLLIRSTLVRDRLECLGVSVRPDAGVARRDATLGRDGGGFNHHQTRAADRATSEVDEVPIVGHPVRA